MSASQKVETLGFSAALPKAVGLSSIIQGGPASDNLLGERGEWFSLKKKYGARNQLGRSAPLLPLGDASDRPGSTSGAGVPPGSPRRGTVHTVRSVTGSEEMKKKMKKTSSRVEQRREQLNALNSRLHRKFERQQQRHRSPGYYERKTQ